MVLGLAPARVPWFAAVTQWTNSAAIAAEFVKCVSAEELRARLTGGRRFSAVLVDSETPALDRDLVDFCAAAATPVVVVRSKRDRPGLHAATGATADLAADFTPEDLLEVLGAYCAAVPTGAAMPPALDDPGRVAAWQAPLVAVTGPGGTGASTIAIAIASGLSGDPRFGGRVLLADLARRADQAVLHDSPDLGPGLQELVEAHRLARPGPLEIHGMTFDVPRRAYRLLLGLRRPEAWAALRPRAVDAALAGLREAFAAVVADVTGDFEGERLGGSADVEERNHLARASVLQATVVAVVGAPGVKGVHSLAVVVRELVEAGVAPERVVAVLNRAPRHPALRAETSRALGRLLGASGTTLALAGPVAVPERKLEDVHRDVSALPSAMVDPVTRAVRAVAQRVADAAPPAGHLMRVTPGSLGVWDDDPERAS